MLTKMFSTISLFPSILFLWKMLTHITTNPRPSETNMHGEYITILRVEKLPLFWVLLLICYSCMRTLAYLNVICTKFPMTIGSPVRFNMGSRRWFSFFFRLPPEFLPVVGLLTRMVYLFVGIFFVTIRKVVNKISVF